MTERPPYPDPAPHEVMPEAEEEDEDPFRARGYCEDFPCCGHEAGDCYGQKYGSDEDIKAAAYERMEMEQQGYFYPDEED